MLNVVIAGFDKALSSAMTGVADLFGLAGVTWNRIQGQELERLFNVRIASPDGGPIRCINGIQLLAHMSYDDVQDVDVIVVPTIGGPVEDVIGVNPQLLALLRRADAHGWTIAGNCTGNFLLAESGILNGKVATTHWGFKDLFEQRYPQVELKADQLITRHDHIYCAGGGLAWFDLGLHIIERNFGFETAIQTAKAFVIDYRRDSQLSYSLMRLSKPHKDDLVKQVQAWLEEHYAGNFTVDELADRFSVSKRTLIRRFNAALDMPPNTYVQSIRIEAAQKLLEETERTVDVVMNDVGYEDASSFRRLFRKKTGLTPTEYRRRFSRRF
ncbi:MULTISPECIES: GlxA family transcriptional regulator [Oceanospirillaceae]|jgi:transcriptional regulator GlxA family with amidase domain|uniref:GlxA family transcriptional regulator n=1 Tax=Oceanospirillaceae TaxID=135620 RepID=UPI0011940AF1|nr:MULTISPECIES: helix-turn-helix domain-containing protein [Thalassolituus]MCB2385682.1 helix-turn-helix domain-containing protein [Thalassolituus alkanivorans]MCB2422780.1 helix-turn-helix domain-containing protein [Thalassolituus alkanivorans]TVV43131.1 helix-turn-helix domain-containing protein [Thalassolituus sp. C2-1]